ncbi:uncharacterized protein LOC127247585 isoform X2 [Andrographis paniculata]|uniref:uncharacterized protein LOC127247585 isoform X2 n=1 Tax=Andrographis paniculata TaxID=175694 RepID=UPI0021E7E607|nr:uncharacterized protein LOC127247585 isoform X2 [Andrographis paniculata]
MSSSGAKGGASRVPIPAGVKKTVENIKEITGQNHSEDEIYAMLRECSMDPNETAQRLLLLDTFHEVRRKRDRRKEPQTKEPGDLKWKSGTQARASRPGRGNYPSRYISHDVGGGRSSASVKENATGPDKGTKTHVALSKDIRKKEISSAASSITAVSNGPSGITSESANVIHKTHASAGGGVDQSNTTSSMSVLDGPLPPSSPIASIKTSKDLHQHQMIESNNASISSSEHASGSYLSSSDPILVPSPDFPLPTAVGTIRREVGSQHATAEFVDDNPSRIKQPSVKTYGGIHNLKQKMPNDFPVVGKNQNVESTQTSSPTVSRPSSNYSNRSQGVGVQKVGPGKEWKPKTSSTNIGQGANAAASVEVSAVTVRSPESQTNHDISTPQEDVFELQRKLEDSQISDGEHVIIPNHLHVPEAGKLGFCFGSFDASFGLDINKNDNPGSEKTAPLTESSEADVEPMKESHPSYQNASAPAEDTEMKYPDHPQSPSPGPEKFSPNEVEVSSSVIPNYNETQPEVTPGGLQHQVAAQTSSNYNIGVMPTILSANLTPLESSESQARDAPRLPSFVVPQSFDPTSYYAQFYRSGMDTDGRTSPFHPAAAANKFNGNAGLVSPQTSQTPQELQGGVPLVLSTASATPLVTQAAGVMQSTISMAQQPLPVFRQPTGVHLPHYPPNYIPYGPYFPPFYVPPPTIHPFLSNGAFPQQPQAGSLYPTAPGTAGKYPVSQYKQGSNTGSSTHIGLPGIYGPYGLSMANYSSGSAASAVTSTSNDDNSASQNKENNGYMSSQQNDGSGVWFTTPGRDISTLQTNSFYNLPPGQLAFTPTQPGHGTFTGIFHPAQAVTTANVHPFLQQSQPITNAGDMTGPTAGVYQQPQYTQLNWPNNY